eukprot:m51a1_g11020 putative c2 domain-containing protein 5 isoform x5 (1083) ;mRNA; f:400608-404580
MPFTLKVRVDKARDLPVMDRSTELADAYVEVKVGDTPTQRTRNIHKSLNPEWKKSMRFEVVDDSHLQDEPIEFRVVDKDIVSRDDSIGVVYVDVAPLLGPAPTKIDGWFPIFDTLKGVRGELSIKVSIEKIENVNPFSNASGGVQFFASPAAPQGAVVALSGLVGDVIVESDPEHHWVDTFRTSRNSNEARQVLLYRLACRLRRHIGKRALELGCNAVLGYRQSLELEGEVVIVARGYGTAASVKFAQPVSPHEGAPSPLEMKLDTTPNQSPRSAAAAPTIVDPLSHALAGSETAEEDDSTPDEQQQQQKQSQQQQGMGAEGLSGSLKGEHSLVGAVPSLPILTMNTFDPGVVCHIGGLVSTRLVRIMDKDSPNAELERERWWAEARAEVVEHALSLGCTHVIGYTEAVTIPNQEDEVCVLSATGTAAVLKPGAFMPSFPAKRLVRRCSGADDAPAMSQSLERGPRTPGRPAKTTRARPCRACHAPYAALLPLPLPVHLSPCLVCGRKKVPDILLATCELPPGTPVLGEGRLLQARSCRLKKRCMGETNAYEVNRALPFLEYDVYRQMINKLRVLGMNAVFGLNISVSVGDCLVAAVATGTAVYLTALPPPSALRVRRCASAGAGETMEHIFRTSRDNINAFQQLARLEQRERSSSSSDGDSPVPKFSASPYEPDSAGEDDDAESKKKKKERVLVPPTPLRKASRAKQRRRKESTGGAEASAEAQSPEKSTRRIIVESNSEQQLKVSEPRSLERTQTRRTLAATTKKRGKQQGSTSSSSSSSETSSHCTESEDDAQVQYAAAARPHGREKPYVVDIDDEMDEELMAVLLDTHVSRDARMCTTQSLPGEWGSSLAFGGRPSQMFIAVRRVRLRDPTSKPQRQLHALCDSFLENVVYSMCDGGPNCLAGISTELQLMDNGDVQIMVLGTRVTPSRQGLVRSSTASAEDDELMLFKMDMPLSNPGTPVAAKAQAAQADHSQVLITPLSALPGCEIKSYLGYVNVHFIRESFSLHDEWGINGLSTDFLVDVLAVVRSQVQALGGTALLSFSVDLWHVKSSEYKDQAYCMISVSGDAVIHTQCSPLP